MAGYCCVSRIQGVHTCGLHCSSMRLMVVSLHGSFLQNVLLASLSGVPGAAIFFVLLLEFARIFLLIFAIPFRDAFLHRVKLVLFSIGAFQLALLFGMLSGIVPRQSDSAKRASHDGVLCTICTEHEDTAGFREFLGVLSMCLQYVQPPPCAECRAHLALVSCVAPRRYVAMFITMGVAVRRPLLQSKFRYLVPKFMHEDPARVVTPGLEGKGVSKSNRNLLKRQSSNRRPAPAPSAGQHARAASADSAATTVVANPLAEQALQV
mgnify:CR=1 FL=1